MARTRVATPLLLLVFVCTLRWVAAQQVDCSTAITSLLGCQDYVTGNAAVPAPTCCSAVASVFSSEPICLCELLLPGGAASLLPGFRPDLALKLPGLCQVNGANPALCNALINGTSPTAPPAPAPSDGSGASPFSEPAALLYSVVMALATATFFL